jgi:hypothetical protein
VIERPKVQRGEGDARERGRKIQREKEIERRGEREGEKGRGGREERELLRGAFNSFPRGGGDLQP